MKTHEDKIEIMIAIIGVALLVLGIILILRGGI
jgi:hypothetical protein